MNADREYCQLKKEFDETFAEYDDLLLQPGNEDKLDDILKKLEHLYFRLCKKVETYQMEILPQQPSAFERVDGYIDAVSNSSTCLSGTLASNDSDTGRSAIISSVPPVSGAPDNTVQNVNSAPVNFEKLDVFIFPPPEYQVTERARTADKYDEKAPSSMSSLEGGITDSVSLIPSSLLQNLPIYDILNYFQSSLRQYSTMYS